MSRVLASAGGKRHGKVTKRFAVVVGWLICAGCGGGNPMEPSQASAPTSAGAARVAPTAPAKGSAAGGGSLVLYDPRERAKLPPGVEREPTLAPEVEKRVFSALASSHGTGRADSQTAQDVTFRVTASATGAFTAPATKQAAYVVASEAGDPAEPGATEATHLVIVEGDKVVLQVSGKTRGESVPFYGTDIRAVVDLDQDGASELLVTAQVATQAGVEEVGRLYTLAGGALKRLSVFPGVYVDTCGTGPQGRAQAQVIHYLPGAKEGKSQYSTERYEAPCPASGAPKPSDFLPIKAPAASPASPTPSEAPSAQPSL